MITATVKKPGWSFGHSIIPVGESYKNPTVLRNGSGWDDWRIIGISMGFECSMFAVKADSDEEAINCLSDSKYGHLIEAEPCEHCQKAKGLEAEKKELDEDAPEHYRLDQQIEGLYNSCECQFSDTAKPISYDNVAIVATVTMNFFAKDPEKEHRSLASVRKEAVEKVTTLGHRLGKWTQIERWNKGHQHAMCQKCRLFVSINTSVYRDNTIRSLGFVSGDATEKACTAETP